jgi:hypothetical protein
MDATGNQGIIHVVVHLYAVGAVILHPPPQLQPQLQPLLYAPLIAIVWIIGGYALIHLLGLIHDLKNPKTALVAVILTKQILTLAVVEHVVGHHVEVKFALLLQQQPQLLRLPLPQQPPQRLQQQPLYAPLIAIVWVIKGYALIHLLGLIHDLKNPKTALVAVILTKQILTLAVVEHVVGHHVEVKFALLLQPPQLQPQPPQLHSLLLPIQTQPLVLMENTDGTMKSV